MSLFKTLRKEGTTIVLVTHSKKRAAYVNRIVFLLDGEIDCKGRAVSRQ